MDDLYVKFNEELVKHLVSMGCDWHTAEDVAQEVWLHIWDTTDLGYSDKQLLAYLKRHGRMMWSRMNERNKLPVLDGEDTETFENLLEATDLASLDPAYIVENIEQYEHLPKWLQMYVDGYTLEEIGIFLGITKQAMSKRLIKWRKENGLDGGTTTTDTRG